MTSLLPLVMLAGFGYLIYRWASSPADPKVGRGSSEVTPQQTPHSRSAKTKDSPAGNSGAAARTATAPF
jgi:hypothetical protein